MGVDLLWNAAVIYGELNNVGYSILLGRKKQMYQLDICFTYESFYHLAGLQHLPDITYPPHSTLHPRYNTREYNPAFSGSVHGDSPGPGRGGPSLRQILPGRP